MQLRVRSAGDSEATPAQMTRDKAYAILGISDNKDLKFDNILNLKNKLLESNSGDRDKLLEVLHLLLLKYVPPHLLPRVFPSQSSLRHADHAPETGWSTF